jgi:hypothetical protein
MCAQVQHKKSVRFSSSVDHVLGTYQCNNASSCTAAALLRFIMPDSLWKITVAAMSAVNGPPSQAGVAGGVRPDTAQTQPGAANLNALANAGLGPDGAAAFVGSRPGTATLQASAMLSIQLMVQAHCSPVALCSEHAQLRLIRCHVQY